MPGSFSQRWFCNPPLALAVHFPLFLWGDSFTPWIFWCSWRDLSSTWRSETWTANSNTNKEPGRCHWCRTFGWRLRQHSVFLPSWWCRGGWNLWWNEYPKVQKTWAPESPRTCDTTFNWQRWAACFDQGSYAHISICDGCKFLCFFRVGTIWHSRLDLFESRRSEARPGCVPWRRYKTRCSHWCEVGRRTTQAVFPLGWQAWSWMLRRSPDA